MSYRYYTEEESNFILAHYKVDMTASEIGRQIGRSRSCIQKFIHLRKQNAEKGMQQLAKVGEIRTFLVSDGRRRITREKQSDGTWKHIKSEVLKAAPGRGMPVGSVKTLSNGRQRIKTEQGWRYAPKPDHEKLKPGGIRPPKFKPGEITKRKTKNGVVREFRKREDGRWDLMPMQFVSKITRTPQNKTDMPKRNTNLTKDKAKRSYDPTKNPDKMKIKKEEGGQWVRINDKTIVYRTNIAS